jgi:signal transduction histidine kinase/ActR/RegA family two-component response regulator
MPGVKLRRRLFLLAAAAIMPLVVMSGIGLFVLAQQQQMQTESAALEIARALLTGVDAELGRSTAVLQTAASSPLLDKRDFHAYHDLLRRIVATQRHWMGVSLALPDGKAVLHTSFAFGADIPGVVERESFEQVVRSNAPVVGHLFKGPAGNNRFAMRVPVIRNDKLLYVLTGVVKPESVLDVIARQRLPNDWVVSVFDAKGIRIARSRAHAEFIGLPASLSMQELMRKDAFEGIGMTWTPDGQEVFTAYSRSPYTGWTVAIGMPPEFLSAGTWGSFTMFSTGVLLSVVFAILAALLIARGINRPIGDLATSAHALGRGEPFFPPTTDIQEIREVADALTAASVERAHSEAEREKLLAREQEARAAAEAANRAKDEFLAMLGHELRNPLGAISNAVRLLEHPRVDKDAARRAREIVARQVDHLSRMTDDLLDAARAITGKIALHRKPVDLAAATADVLSMLKPRTEGRRMVQELVPAWVDADPTRLEQIIANLVENAVKYTPVGGTVRVTVGKEGSQAVLRVADNGVGMSPELATRVFELFVQGNRELDRSHGGLGIGLTLVRRLAELHGGSAEAKSAGPGQGSEFIVCFPSIADREAETRNTSAGRHAAPHDILIVEDNTDARESLRILLEYAGHRVRTASDGAAGLDAALASPPDVALIDVGLPKLDGYEVARRIRTASPVPIFLVALTGYGLPDDRARALAAGFDAHLVKPVDETTLEELIAGVEARSKTIA